VIRCGADAAGFTAAAGILALPPAAFALAGATEAVAEDGLAGTTEAVAEGGVAEGGVAA
jgi:hypothetical protein